MSSSEDFHEREESPIVPAELTPPIMWPEDGSGFEADPLSPAGMSQQIWRMTGRRPHTRTGRWVLRVVCVVIAAAFIAAQVAH